LSAEEFKLRMWKKKFKDLGNKMDELELQLAIMKSKYLNK